MSGLALPKPERRGPKPRKPIARTSKPARVRKTARGKARHSADLEWSKAIRESGPCAARGVTVSWREIATPHEEASLNFLSHRTCYGQKEAAHIVSRRYAATRTDLNNGLPLCHFIHSFFTEHPMGWEAFVVKKIGAVAYGALKQKALAGPKAAQ